MSQELPYYVPGIVPPMGPSPVNTDALVSLLQRYMSIDHIVWESLVPQSGQVIARFIGWIHGDTAQAYRELDAHLQGWHITPLFRFTPDRKRHMVILIQGRLQPQPSRVWVNALLFVLTLLSVMLTGFLYHGGGLEALVGVMRFPGVERHWAELGRAFWRGMGFTAALMGILLVHELGHYFAARWHRVSVTLPYFIPFPPFLSPFGTLGAFIRLKAPPTNRRVLLDIGLAGPLAGFLVAIPTLFLGLALSQVHPLPSPGSGEQLFLEGNSLLYLLAKWLLFGKPLPQPLVYDGPAWLYWLRFFFTGRPIPWGGTDVVLHPVAFAAWAGLLVTALNLIPVGQLDGGHIVYAWLGHRAARLRPWVLGALVVLGLVWTGWWLWFFIAWTIGRAYAEPLDTVTPLDPPRRLLAWVGILLLVLTFVPVPMQVAMGR